MLLNICIFVAFLMHSRRQQHKFRSCKHAFYCESSYFFFTFFRCLPFSSSTLFFCLAHVVCRLSWNNFLYAFPICLPSVDRLWCIYRLYKFVVIERFQRSGKIYVYIYPYSGANEKNLNGEKISNAEKGGKNL